MHDTAHRIGGLAIEYYAPQQAPRILEIGSLDVNGSLRHHVPDQSNYIGLDFSEGPGVDHVVTDETPWPVEDNSFDLVMASSVFEHDPFFWETFCKMLAKAKPGGFVYVNAPSNGWVHRYPLDCWRFYPDCGKALIDWAQRQGYGVTLIESFVAERETDVWNDFCAVFQKSPASSPPPSSFIHHMIPCVNVITWQERNITSSREKTEDMVLIETSRDAKASCDQEVQKLIKRVAESQSLLAAAESESQKMAAMAKSAWQDVERHERELVRAREDAAYQKKELMQLNARQTDMEAALRSAFTRTNAAENKLMARFAELTTITARLLMSETDLSIKAAQNLWLKRLTTTSMAIPLTWRLLPKAWRQKRMHARYLSLGLFDADAYLTRYPDVAAARMDPVDHYIRHGMNEGRIAECNGERVA